MPEQLETAIAKRSSQAAATRAVLPPRECPITATCLASSVGSVSIQSRTRLAAQAHAESAPQAFFGRYWRSTSSNAANTPRVLPCCLSGVTSLVWNAIVA